MTPRLVLAVAAAGALGALARAGLAAVLPSAVVATLLANLTGCLLLGLLVGRSPSPRLRAVLGTGLLGGWTTWSGLAVQVDLRLGDDPSWAVAHLALSVVAGAALARLGLRLSAR